MPLLSPKRQITIPKDVCDRLHVEPGDELDIFEHEGHVTLVKKRKGASRGALKHLTADHRYSDEESLIDAILSGGPPGSKNEREHR
ncbi:AbrB/MazE/SpoVT family DNA-binding domain-containing protein [Acidiferrobacter sp.]|uniref:AbrB/MazE/SpoVT family DNA-binding domain-containing protein n=1 Tax=Acidiferrobacter sp. TaxID=1872107 RepID=UPI00345B94A7